MNRKSSMLKSIVLTAALAASISGIAHADDSSLNPFTGDSYAAFNAGNLPEGGKPVFDQTASAWRQTNPDGLSERVFQAYSGTGEEWHLNRPVFDRSASTWRESHPNGLSETQFQAMSSEAPVWHSPNQSSSTALASSNENGAAKSAANGPFATRIAKLFRASSGSDAASSN
jgi:hypothetical protein